MILFCHGAFRQNARQNEDSDMDDKWSVSAIGYREIGSGRIKVDGMISHHNYFYLRKSVCKKTAAKNN